MLLIKKKLLNRFTYRCHSIDVDHKAQEGALVVGPLKKKTFFESFLVHMCAVISQLPSSIRAMVNSAKGRGSLALKVRELRFRRDT